MTHGPLAVLSWPATAFRSTSPGQSFNPPTSHLNAQNYTRTPRTPRHPSLILRDSAHHGLLRHLPHGQPGRWRLHGPRRHRAVLPHRPEGGNRRRLPHPLWRRDGRPGVPDPAAGGQVRVVHVLVLGARCFLRLRRHRHPGRPLVPVRPRHDHRYRRCCLHSSRVHPIHRAPGKHEGRRCGVGRRAGLNSSPQASKRITSIIN